MPRRILRPSERIKLQELGLTRAEMDEYADSDFQNVDEWLAVKKYNAEPEDVRLFKASGFESFDDFKIALEMGFELQDEYEQAMGGSFPNRASWIIARELGFLTYKKYLDHLAEKKALDSLTPAPRQQSTVPSISSPVQQEKPQNIIEKPIRQSPIETQSPLQHFNERLEEQKLVQAQLRVESRTPIPDKLVLEKPKPTSRPLSQSTQPPPLSQPPPIKSEPIPTPIRQKITEYQEKEEFKPKKEKLMAKAYQGGSIIDLLQKFPVPNIENSDFIDNPELERMFRFAEVLEQTLEANLEDFTTALSFEDVAEMEEWLEKFDSSLFNINLEKNLIFLKPEVYPLVIEQVEILRKK